MRVANRLTEPAAAAAARPSQVQPASRFLFYSHDGLGLGHLRRNLAVATAVATLDPRASILIATGAEEAHRFPIPPTIDILKLPSLRKIDNGRYAARRLNVTWRDVRSVRAALLLATVSSFRPSVLLVDKHPLGVGGELEPALEQMRADGGSAVLGLRDVLDDPKSVRTELEHGLFERIADYYDRVLVYGQPDVLDARREYAFPDAVAAMTRFCGYVVAAELKRPRSNAGNGRAVPDRPRVLATAGGGEDGVALLAAFVEAAARSRWDAGVVSGPQCSGEDAGRLAARASEAGVRFRQFVPNLSAEFAFLDALVCMGGYNTLTEAAACGVSTVCVPRVQPRTEQLIRAHAFEDRGLVKVLEPNELDPAALRTEVESALGQAVRGQRRVRKLDLGGARRAAGHLVVAAASTVGARTSEGGRP